MNQAGIGDHDTRESTPTPGRWVFPGLMIMFLALTPWSATRAQDDGSAPGYDPGQVFSPVSSSECENLSRLWQARLDYLKQQCDACRERQAAQFRTDCSRYELDPKQYSACKERYFNPDHGPDAWGQGQCGSYHALYRACDGAENQWRCAQVRMERACRDCRQKLEDFQKYQRWESDEARKRQSQEDQARQDKNNFDKLQEDLLNSWRKRGEEESQATSAPYLDDDHARLNEAFKAVDSAGDRKDGWDLMSGLPDSVSPGSIASDTTVSRIQAKAHNELVGSAHQTLDYLNYATSSMESADAKGNPSGQPVTDYKARVRPLESATGATSSSEDGPSFDEIVGRNASRGSQASSRLSNGPAVAGGPAGLQGSPSGGASVSEGAVATPQNRQSSDDAHADSASSHETNARLNSYFSNPEKVGVQGQSVLGASSPEGTSAAVIAGTNPNRIQGASSDKGIVTFSSEGRACVHVTLQILSADGRSIVARKRLRLDGGKGSFALKDMGLATWDPRRVRIEGCAPCEVSRPDWLK